MKSISRQIEDRIERQQRIGRNIRTGNAKVMYFPQNTGRSVAAGLSPSSFEWRCDYFSEAKYARTGVNTAIGVNSITVDNGDTGAAGTYSATNLTWTDGTKSWATDQFVGYFLKVNSVYYKILSNTATVLTLKIIRRDTIQNTSYSIVPFTPNSLVGLIINPDTDEDETYVIESNTETIITIIPTSMVATGAILPVTTGDAGAPYDTFRASALIGYAANHWQNYTVLFVTGTNAGESQVVSTYAQATGEFVMVTGFSAAIDNGDLLRILRPVLNVSVGATWRLDSGYIPGASDFASNVGNLLPREVGISSAENLSARIAAIFSGFGLGGVDDSNFEKPFVGRYAVEILSESTKSIGAMLDFNGAINIQLINMVSNKRTLIKEASSPSQLTQPAMVLFSLEAFTWYRIEIYLYVPQVINGKLKLSNISNQINSWRDVTAGAPTVVSITGADLANADDSGTMGEELITLTWTNNTYFIRGNTSIHESDTENGTYSSKANVGSHVNSIALQYQPGTTKWFKLRHISLSGVRGPFTDPQKGVTASAGTGNTTIDLTWVDNADTAVTPNKINWFNDSVLKAKITVTTDLTIDTITFNRTGAASEDLGSSSPATSSALAETAVGTAQVMVTFTNGMSLASQFWFYQYDKTVPAVAVITNDTGFINNFQIVIPIASGGTDANSGFDRWDWYWSESSTDPTGGTSPIRTTFESTFRLDLADYDFDSTTLYIWVSAKDKAGNVSAWTQYNGASGSLSLEVREITGKHEWKDLVEFVE